MLGYFLDIIGLLFIVQSYFILHYLRLFMVVLKLFIYLLLFHPRLFLFFLSYFWLFYYSNDFTFSYFLILQVFLCYSMPL